jgi:inward rectifier potassium channel
MPIRVGAYELTKKGAARYDPRDLYHLLVSLSWPQFLLLLLVVVLLIHLVFATLYVVAPGSIANVRPGSFTDAFFFSIETLATVGYGVMAPASLYGHVVSAGEILCGMAFTAIVTGMIFVRFSRPRAKIVYATHPVVTTFNGQLTLMIRIGNGRLSLMTDAHAELNALMKERTDEGSLFRRSHDLRLVRDRLPMFALTWTLMHPIDDDSPLAGYDAARLTDGDVRLYLTVQARDHAMAVEVFDMKDYGAEDILFGMRYVDAVTIDGAGNTIADLTRISFVEPDGHAENSHTEQPALAS